MAASHVDGATFLRMILLGTYRIRQQDWKWLSISMADEVVPVDIDLESVGLATEMP